MILMNERLDALISQSLDNTVRHEAPHWFEPEADTKWLDQLRPQLDYRPGHRRRRLTLGVAASAVLLLGWQLGQQTLQAAILPSRVKFAAGASQILNQNVAPAQVTLEHPAPHRAIVVNHGNGRWRTIGWQEIHSQWRPVTLTARVAGITVTYHIVVGHAPGVVLFQAGEARLAQHLKNIPYSPKDTPTGAIARLPMHFPAYKTQGLGQPKVIVSLGHGRTVLALTYQVPSGSKTLYAPSGWYWWYGAPPVLRGIPAPWTTFPL